MKIKKILDIWKIAYPVPVYKKDKKNLVKKTIALLVYFQFSAKYLKG